jgi:hypothetical protein
MKKKYNHNPRPHKSPSTGSQPNASAAPPKAIGPQAQGPTVEEVHWRYEYAQLAIVPIKPPPGWSEAKDKKECIRLLGKCDDYWHDTAVLLKESVAEAHEVLESGIMYFAAKCEAPLLVSLSKLNLREKVALFAGLLPASADRQYILRLSMRLARILWLESERERITQGQNLQRWVFPFAYLAQSLGAVADQLREDLSFENDEFIYPGFGEEVKALLAR